MGRDSERSAVLADSRLGLYPSKMSEGRVKDDVNMDRTKQATYDEMANHGGPLFGSLQTMITTGIQ